MVTLINWMTLLSPLRPKFCGLAEEELKDIPFAFSASSPSERADQIDQGTAIYRALVADLLSIAPDQGTRTDDWSDFG